MQGSKLLPALGAAAWLMSVPTSAQAVGECGLACCLAGVSSSGVTQAGRFGIGMLYEYADMETIRSGSEKFTPNEVLNRLWTPGSSYSVPTKMTMEKYTLIASFPVSARLTLLGIVPYVRNTMDMRMRTAMGMTMNMRMTPVEGLGDITVMALHTAYTDAPIRPTRRLTLGFGIKTPTGENDTRTASGNLVHAMMQAGTGSWDAVFTANYMRAWYPLVTQVNVFWHWTNESDLDYEFGDQVGIDLVARYQVAAYVNLGLELNAIHAGRDEDDLGLYSRPATSMLDNTANTGLTSVFVSPGVQVKIPNSGGSVEIKYQLPVYQYVNGYQQVVDRRILASMAWSF